MNHICKECAKLFGSEGSLPIRCPPTAQSKSALAARWRPRTPADRPECQSQLRFGPVGASLGPKGLCRAITASLLRGAVYSSLSYTTKEGLFVQDLPNGFTGFANKAKEQNTNPLDALLRAEHKEPKEDNTPTPTLSKEEVQAIAPLRLQRLQRLRVHPTWVSPRSMRELSCATLVCVSLS